MTVPVVDSGLAFALLHLLDINHGVGVIDYAVSKQLLEVNALKLVIHNYPWDDLGHNCTVYTLLSPG